MTDRIQRGPVYLRLVGDFAPVNPSFPTEREETPIPQSTPPMGGHVVHSRGIWRENNPHWYLRQLIDRIGDASSDPEATALNSALHRLFMQYRKEVLSPSSLGCMDPRISGKSVALGGSGILTAYAAGEAKGKTGWSAVLAGLPFVAASLKNEVFRVTSHESCLACGIVFQRLSREDRERFHDSDQIGKMFSPFLAGLLKVPYHHIGLPEMVSDPHPARIVVYTGTHHFQAERILPPGAAFVISRAPLERMRGEIGESQGKLHLETALDIVLKQDGMNGPALVLPIGGTVGRFKLIHEAHETAAKFPGRVLVMKGFDASLHGHSPLFRSIRTLKAVRR